MLIQNFSNSIEAKQLKIIQFTKKSYRFEIFHLLSDRKSRFFSDSSSSGNKIRLIYQVYMQPLCILIIQNKKNPMSLSKALSSNPTKKVSLTYPRNLVLRDLDFRPVFHELRYEYGCEGKSHAEVQADYPNRADCAVLRK